MGQAQGGEVVSLKFLRVGLAGFWLWKQRKIAARPLFKYNGMCHAGRDAALTAPPVCLVEPLKSFLVIWARGFKGRTLTAKHSL